jgi:drug/metabolite transporter (DMT)-like permease
MVLSVLWGGTFLFVELALPEVPPLTLVLSRVVLAAAALGVVLRLTGAALPRGRALWVGFLGMAILNNVVPFSLFFWAQTQIGAGLAAVLNATTPLWSVVLAHLLTTDEKATPAKVAGVALGFAGVAVMVGGAALEGAGDRALAQGACLLAALSYACSALWGRRFKALGAAPMSIAFGQLCVSSALMLPLALLVERPHLLPMPGAQALAAVLALALLSTALAYVIFFRVLASAGSTNLMLVTFLIPVSAVALGVLVLGEALEPRQVVGMATIGLGLAAIDGRLVRRLRRG